MQTEAKKMFKYLNKVLKDAPILIHTRDYGEDISIDIEPVVSLPDGTNAKISIGFHEGFDITVDIGQGNHFDIEDGLSEQTMEYLTDIVKACISGKAEEVVRRKGGKVVKSKLMLVLPDGQRTFYYRSSLLVIGGTKTHIKYQPYAIQGS